MSVHLYVERVGSGPPVVFSHGAGQDSSAWRHQTGALSGRATTIAWDLRGHGRSERPPKADDYSLAHALDDLAVVLHGIDAAGKTGPAAGADGAAGASAGGAGAAPVLAGHSFGGYLSLAHVLAHPGTVRGLFLVATGPGFRDPEARRRWNESALTAADRLGLPEAVVHLIVQEDDHVISGLPGIEIPAVVVVGERDRNFRAAADYLAAKLPRPRLVVVEGAGHAVQETHPEPVTAALVDLLDELDQGDSAG